MADLQTTFDPYVCFFLRDVSLCSFALYAAVLTTGLISQANGSAYIETVRTKIACAVCVAFQS